MLIFRYFFFVIVLCAPAVSQGVDGVISGTVTDGMLTVGGATVNVRNAETGVSAWSGKTNPAGVYRAPELTAGRYDIDITAAGFRRAQISGVELSVDQRADLSVILKPGPLTETITVEGEGNGQLGSDSSSLATTITPSQLEGVAAAEPSHAQSAGAHTGRIGRRRNHRANRIEFFAACDQRQPHFAEGNEFLLDGISVVSGSTGALCRRRCCRLPIPFANSRC